jgi:hypothetical protein
MSSKKKSAIAASAPAVAPLFDHFLVVRLQEERAFHFSLVFLASALSFFY